MSKPLSCCLRTQLFKHEYAAQGILYGSIWCRRTGCHSHDDILTHIQKEGFRYDLPRDSSMSNGIVGMDASHHG
jgi:hypothetical protein